MIADSAMRTSVITLSGAQTNSANVQGRLWLGKAAPERNPPCAIRSPCWSAAELVARAFALGIGCFGSCSRVGGPNGVTA